MPSDLRVFLLAAGALGLCACTHSSYTVYALTSTGTLLSFESDKPGTIASTVTVSGLASGDSLIQLGYLPRTAQLYGLTSNNEVGTVDPTSGAVTLVSTAPFTTNTLVDATASFDPTTSELRVLSTQYNYVVDSTTWNQDSSNTEIAYDSGDTNVNKSPELLSMAYSNDTPGATTTTLYALDEATYSLVTVGGLNQSSPTSVDDGLLHTIGTVGVNFASAGLAIDQQSGDAYAALNANGSSSSLYQVDLKTGGTSVIDEIGGGGYSVISIALLPASP